MELVVNERNLNMKSELEKYGENCKVKIASAFFSNKDLVESFLENRCEIQLIVRLGEGTNSQRLKDIIKKPNIRIRYYTGNKFHPKIYIFKNKIAYIGSSNFTMSGCSTNSEANVSIEPENIIYEELENHFEHLWKDALVLNEEILNEFHQVNGKYYDELYKLEKKKEKELKEFYERYGSEEASLVIDKVKKDKKLESINNYRKEYQDFLKEYEKLKKIYLSLGKRKISENKLPLRIEIDQFFNWIKENKFKKIEVKEFIPKPLEELEITIPKLIEEYHSDSYPYFTRIVDESYPIIKEKFKNFESINKLSKEELRETLYKIHAFSGQGWMNGGDDLFFEKFYKKNGEEKIKERIGYILFGKGSFEERLANYYYGDKRLYKFGESCSKELFGWINNENIPIYNQRTHQSLKYLGFDL